MSRARRGGQARGANVTQSAEVRWAMMWAVGVVQRLMSSRRTRQATKRGSECLMREMMVEECLTYRRS